MNRIKMVKARIIMLGGKIEDKAVFDYIVMKSENEMKNFCHVKELPSEAEQYIIDWIVSNYMTETIGYSKQWERMREEAEKGLVSFRRMRW